MHAQTHDRSPFPRIIRREGWLAATICQANPILNLPFQEAVSMEREDVSAMDSMLTCSLWTTMHSTPRLRAQMTTLTVSLEKLVDNLSVPNVEDQFKSKGKMD